MTKLMSLSIAGWMIAPGSGTGLLVEPSEDIALASFPFEQVTRLWFSVQLPLKMDAPLFSIPELQLKWL